MQKFFTRWAAVLGISLLALSGKFVQAKEAPSKNDSPNTSNASDQATTEVDDESEKPNPTKVRMAHIKIAGELPESPGQMSFFGDLGVDLRKTVARLDQASQDKKIAGVILEVGPAALTRGKVNELREAIARVRAEDKKVYAHVEMAMSSQYLLASACDEVVMPEAGTLLIPGVHAELSYFKEMLEKLGIEADIMHVGNSKGAAEPFTRTNMSEPVRTNLTALVDDIFDQMLTTIAADRQLRVQEVRAAVDQGLFTATQAKEAGLIDRLAYPDQFRTRLKGEHSADELVYVLNYGKRKVDTDFSGPMGMMKLFQMILGGSNHGSSKGPRIAIVYAVGPIMSGESQNDPFSGQVMGSETIVEALQEAADDEQVRAIVLRINSPGGSALASDLIWRATQATDKPIVASMGDVAASGGYYIAMGADKIIAEPGTVTGSIGVVGGKMSLSGFYDKIGLTTDLISRGKNSGMFSSTGKFTESERKVVSSMMHDVYRLFTTKAAEGRNMPVEKIESLAGGQVYTGRDAKRNGLVDKLGTLKDAIQLAKRLAGIDADEKVKLKILPEPKNPFESLFKADLDTEREAKILGVASIMPELTAPLQRAYQLRQVMREPVAVLMPMWVEIK